MSTNERDTHFQEFAKLLWQELDEKGEFNIDMESDRSHDIVTEIIARRAYDLVEHTLKEVNYYMLDGTNPFEWAINSVPDMTSFPEQATPQSP